MRRTLRRKQNFRNLFLKQNNSLSVLTLSVNQVVFVERPLIVQSSSCFCGYFSPLRPFDINTASDTVFGSTSIQGSTSSKYPPCGKYPIHCTSPMAKGPPPNGRGFGTVPKRLCSHLPHLMRRVFPLDECVTRRTRANGGQRRLYESV